MSLASKVPVQIDRILASSANKIALQKLCSIFLTDVAESKHLKISSTLNRLCTNSSYLFFDKRINALWLKFGTGSYTPMLPMYIMHGNIGHEMRSVILRLHVLTGRKVTSKIGTKYGALNAKPIDYLKKFGQSENLCHEEAEKAEWYLVKVLRPSSACTTMNELRIESYIDKNSFLIQLPPTSPSIFVHTLHLILLFISTWIFWIRQRSPMFKNLVGLKLKTDVLFQTNAYHQYLATLSSNVDAKKYVPDVASVRLQI